MSSSTEKTAFFSTKRRSRSLRASGSSPRSNRSPCTFSSRSTVVARSGRSCKTSPPSAGSTMPRSPRGRSTPCGSSTGSASWRSAPVERSDRALAASERGPRERPDDAVGGKAFVGLKRADGAVGLGPEEHVHRDRIAAEHREIHLEARHPRPPRALPEHARARRLGCPAASLVAALAATLVVALSLAAALVAPLANVLRDARQRRLDVGRRKVRNGGSSVLRADFLSREARGEASRDNP